jgi:outer membrane lipoprotein SlyB
MSKGLLTIFLVVAVCVGTVFVAGCESEGQTDALVGSAAGAGIGAIIGNQSGKAGQGALIGGAVGGGTGYIIGSEQDKKKTQAEMNNLRQEMNTVTVNVTNSNGSVSTVVLRKQGVGYVGPRGEYYNNLPTPEQLKPVYGF